MNQLRPHTLKTKNYEYDFYYPSNVNCTLQLLSVKDLWESLLPSNWIKLNKKMNDRILITSQCLHVILL